MTTYIGDSNTWSGATPKSKQSSLITKGIFAEEFDDGEYSKNDRAVGQIIFHLEYVVGNTFRYVMLVGVCS